MIPRLSVLKEARAWIGTPYQHQASARGAGCDCLGLVRGVWRTLYGAEPELAPPYTPDWAERLGEETLYQAALRHLVEVESERASPGDVLLFRMEHGSPMKHAAILDEGEAIIHAYWGRAVVRSRFAPWWRTRWAATFQFPNIEPWPNSSSAP
ncbi:MAG: C40 family peptidase [Hyphomonadaceae bacterium]|nr:C40 family peptidase [Hyphomonadaceae bacterium]